MSTRGPAFAQLREIYNAMIFAAWLRAFKESLLGKVYVDRRKISGVTHTKRDQGHLSAYLQAFKKGVFILSRKSRTRPRGQWSRANTSPRDEGR